MLTHALLVAAATAAALLLAAGLIHLLPRLGLGALTRWFCKAPGLDLWIAYFTVAPAFAGPIAMAALTPDPAGQPDSNWPEVVGLLAAIAGQVLAVCIWTPLHELAHPQAAKGPRIVHQINRNVGRWRNHTAVWVTALAVPVFAVIRIAELVVYPPLTWLIRLPRYTHSEWVNVSRHKFSGLVGHDLIWCLYCDWMTGVWSLGGEMLRNVESFWCPIRFRSDKKCENCKVDYPDINGGWAPADADMQAVVNVLADKYPAPNGDNSWFGHPARAHPARLTVEGRPPAPAAANDPAGNPPA